MKTTIMGVMPLMLLIACSGGDLDAKLAEQTKRLDAALSRINTLEDQLSALQGINPADIAGLAANVRTMTDDVDSLENDVNALQTANTATNKRIDDTDSAVAAIDLSVYDNRLASLETKTQSMRIGKNITAPTGPNVLLFDGMDVVFTDLNVFIQSGVGPQKINEVTTWEVNGKGNLTLGYNELTNLSRPRSGSHNLILGYGNSYSSWGAIVAGEDNQSTDSMASILGGGGNIASGSGSVVVSGGNNTADGGSTAILSGFQNSTTNTSSSVAIVGGFNNASSHRRSVIVGLVDGNTTADNQIVP